MKKLCYFSFVIVLMIILCGCSFLFESGSDKTTYTPIITKLGVPDVTALGNTVLWDTISEATEYDVYSNNTFLTTVSDTYYIASELSDTTAFYIIAKNQDESRNSQKSNNVILYKNCDFSSEETMEIKLSNNSGYYVPATINYVTVSGTAVNSYIIISDRTKDIVIELDNVNITSLQNKNCISTDGNSYDFSLKRYSATIIVKGTNLLNGSNYNSKPQKPSENSGRKGTKGGEGGSGIVLPNIALTGNGSLTINGGNGGEGGDGSNSSGFSSAVYGHGGDGGSGGSGIKCTTLLLVMDITGITSTHGGLAGTRGAPGGNGSVLTGPFNTANWSNCYGDNGVNGSSLIGAIKQISGVYIN